MEEPWHLTIGFVWLGLTAQDSVDLLVLEMIVVAVLLQAADQAALAAYLPVGSCLEELEGDSADAASGMAAVTLDEAAQLPVDA